MKAAGGYREAMQLMGYANVWDAILTLSTHRGFWLKY